jgi:hypothetical protein
MTKIEVINETQFYNILQDMAITKTIMDLRDNQSYKKSHAKSSYNLIGIENYDENKTLDENFNSKQLKGRGMTYKKGIFYHDDEEINKKMCDLLEKDGKFNIVYVLKSYSEFEKKYPFMCTREDFIPETKVFPTEVLEDFLYLGKYT